MKFNLAVVFLTVFGTSVLAGPMLQHEQRDVAPVLKARDAEPVAVPALELEAREALPEAEAEAEALPGWKWKAAKMAGKGAWYVGKKIFFKE